MSLEDRLAAQRATIATDSEEPVIANFLAEEIRVFAALLLQSGRYNDAVVANIQKIQVQVCSRMRPGFSDTYKIEYLKAAMWLAGLYDSVYLD